MLYILMKKITKNALPSIFHTLGSHVKSFYFLSLHSLFKTTSFQSGSL